MHEYIIIKGARMHNLKNLTVTIPKQQLVVMTGLSGSGKSTLVFDILYMEGQRQYMESLGISNETLQKPEFDVIEGLAPSIAVGQNAVNRNPRSTVGTSTEIFTYLRLLYARIGHRPCPNCGQDVPPAYATINGDTAWDDASSADQGQTTSADSDTYPCPACGTQIPELNMAHFSFNTPIGACPTCTGLGKVHQVNVGAVINEDISFLEGAVSLWNQMMVGHHSNSLLNAAKHFGFAFDLNAPIKSLGPIQRDLLLYGASSPEFQKHFPDVKPPKSVGAGNFEGVIPVFLRRYETRAEDTDYREDMESKMIMQECPTCKGARLRPESQRVTVHGQSIVDAARIPLTDLAAWLAAMPGAVAPEELTLAGPILNDLSQRVQRLVNVGVGYLSLERSTPTLSAGEAQRLRLASLLGSGLTGVIYVLDEPTTGLHPRDNGLLIDSLRRMRDGGNTIVVVEHDLDIVQAADYVVEMGPGAGDEGGRVIASGSPAEVAASAESVTGGYLAGRASIPVPKRRALNGEKQLIIQGAREHNLKNVTVHIPLGGLIAVTGVSGSGKSTLMLDILNLAARRHFYRAGDTPGVHDTIEGWEHLDKIVTTDQVPIGRTPRSNAATFTDAFDPIRKAFAATDEARQRKLKAEYFSFNVAGGRCERCQGAGVLTVKMQFLPEALVRCPACHGRRFKREILEVHYKGYSIADVLDMSIREAHELFQKVPAVASKLSLLVDVGLGYLRLGQPATTLSGGEIQRVKLAKELARRSTGRTLYLLDEPTTGLHVADVARLLLVLQRLVDSGNTVIVIEHNLDVIKSADWIIDLGPEGGAAGGQLIAKGTPEQVAQVEESYTGRALCGIVNEA